MKNIKDINISELNSVLAAIAAKEAKGKSLTTLESFQYGMISALIAEKEKVAELQTKVKASSKRDVKAPDSYDVLQPLFVALRGSINKGIVSNDVLINLFQDVLNRLKITLSVDISKKLFIKTVLHNSVSNMAKATELKGLESRNKAYIEMVEQAKVLLVSIDDTFWNDCQNAIDTATAKQKTVLKIA